MDLPVVPTPTLKRRRLTPAPLTSTVNPISVQSLFESLLASNASVDDLLAAILATRNNYLDKISVAEGFSRLGSEMIKASHRYKRRIDSKHNTEMWPFPPDLSVKIFSKLDTRMQCYVSATCYMFNKFAQDPLCYAHIDLRKETLNLDNSVVSRMIERAGKHLRSLKLGVWSDKSPELSSSLTTYTGNCIYYSVQPWDRRYEMKSRQRHGLDNFCLLALSINGGASGGFLRSLHLYNIKKMDNTALCTALSACHSLIELEIIGLHVELRRTLQCLSENCNLLERLFFESEDDGDETLFLQTCKELVKGCPGLTTLVLRNVELSDKKILTLLNGLSKLKKIDFSSSCSFTGKFLRKFVGNSNLLQVLLLHWCHNITEAELIRFLGTCLSGGYNSLKYLGISADHVCRDSDIPRNCLGTMISRFQTERPDIHLVAKSPSSSNYDENDEDTKDDDDDSEEDGEDDEYVEDDDDDGSDDSEL
ncbi:hypothetical protein ZOSMA_185G00470 [Zostera marina]|uniref:F-box domain-containing protein n=1 Tax=Zostera marina TaxID=29655 RepID=A0A0K9PQ82_ZOSMR|nr:hypothetical protein ZOSMA_185G00470 [Zostera marina]